ncbi:hypothetical protein PGT21_012909 [Puccinia graminis f. sp. tritici]|uniref:Uncharacterized protein n=1 Tax=Puccinia graminis f. sp. tritici TaxID=56615 RepID=A0A5B0PDA2_PUCGR|nr:hypothetical protein PGTUg99_004064 [Puccinia graminis f. sp. tritici]KAA1099575.1 hypothetical protein PGT21_012909 [Puccinia graminis f. sp. tritici]
MGPPGLATTTSLRLPMSHSETPQPFPLRLTTTPQPNSATDTPTQLPPHTTRRASHKPHSAQIEAHSPHPLSIHPIPIPLACSCHPLPPFTPTQQSPSPNLPPSALFAIHQNGNPARAQSPIHTNWTL